jgi:hypothetical protein
MSFDGETVRDSQHDTIEEAQEASADMGSKWFFYPWHIIVKGVTVKEMGGTFTSTKTDRSVLEEIFANKRLSTVKKFFNKISKRPDAQDLDSEAFEMLIITS